MTVEELIKELQKHLEDADVIVVLNPYDSNIRQEPFNPVTGINGLVYAGMEAERAVCIKYAKR